MEDLQKILIIRFSSIGDIVLASPLVRAVRTRYPAAQIDFLVKSEFAELVKFSHHLSTVIELRTADRRELKDLKKRIREEHYDVILDIHNSLRSRYLRGFSGAKSIGVVNKRVVDRFFLVHSKLNFYDRIIPVAERYLETAMRLGISDDSKGLELFIPDETMFAVSSALSKFRLERYDTVIGFAPAAKHFTKRWPQERFVELGVLYAKERKAKILVFGGKEDVEYCGDIAQMINTASGSGVAEIFAGRFSLLETAAALDSCDVVICNDTGVMHLAAARQRRIVAVFGSTVREFGFFPYGTESIVMESKGLSCRPCSHIGLEQCPKGHFKCMKDVLVDDVMNAVSQLVNNTEQHTS
ncbi:MAG: glycosyltransferase family 9 protein [Bacteroidota bacterium]|jgi:heptosyltransferase-2